MVMENQTKSKTKSTTYNEFVGIYFFSLNHDDNDDDDNILQNVVKFNTIYTGAYICNNRKERMKVLSAE